MMVSSAESGYARHDGFQIVTRPFCNADLQFVILLPDKPEALDSLVTQLSPKLLQECAHLAAQKVILHLPKFRLEPPTLPLDTDLKKLGMSTAFDEPRGSANFDRMAPRSPTDYLFISAVLHKAFLALDENGVEAAAATAVVMAQRAAAMAGPKPVEVNVDHPFLFAIQHVPSGACLFLGRLIDPR
jgi:serpin B